MRINKEADSAEFKVSQGLGLYSIPPGLRCSPAGTLLDPDPDTTSVYVPACCTHAERRCSPPPPPPPPFVHPLIVCVVQDRIQACLNHTVGAEIRLSGIFPPWVGGAFTRGSITTAT